MSFLGSISGIGANIPGPIGAVSGAVSGATALASGCPPKPTLRERLKLCSDSATRDTKCAQCWSHFPSLVPGLAGGYVFNASFPASQDEKDLLKQGIVPASVASDQLRSGAGASGATNTGGRLAPGSTSAGAASTPIAGAGATVPGSGTFGLAVAAVIVLVLISRR